MCETSAGIDLSAVVIVACRFEVRLRDPGPGRRVVGGAEGWVRVMGGVLVVRGRDIAGEDHRPGQLRVSDGWPLTWVVLEWFVGRQDVPMI